MDSPAPPPVPDPVVTANAQGQANDASTRLMTQLNRANQVTPFGSQTWSNNGDDWTSTLNLDPRIVQALTTQLDTSNGLQGATQDALGRVNSTLGRPPPTALGSYTDALNFTNQQSQTPGLNTSADWNVNSGLNYGQAGTLTQGNLPGVRRGVDNSRVTQQAQGMMAPTEMTLLNQLKQFNGMGALPQASDTTRQQVENALYARDTSRLDPQYQQQENQLRSSLLNRGLTEGSPAWNAEMANFGQQKNDAYSTARNDAITMGGNEEAQQLQSALGIRQQGVNELGAAGNAYGGATGALSQMLGQGIAQQGADTAQRVGEAGINTSTFNANQAAQVAQQNANTALFGTQQQAYGQQFNDVNQARATQQQLDQSKLSGISGLANNWFNMQGAERSNVLNELASLRSGMQVQQPTFGQTPSGATNQPAPIAQSIWNAYQANQNNYNTGVGSSNQAMGGISSILAAMMMPSDRRLKQNIRRVGTHPLGIGWYKYDYLWGEPGEGVMAQELLQVLPSAVAISPDGFLSVDYAQLGF